MASDMLKDTILENLKKDGGNASIIELMSSKQNQEALERDFKEIGQQSNLNTVFLKVSLVGKPRQITLYHLEEGILKEVWTHVYRSYGKEIRDLVIGAALTKMRHGRSLVIINFVTNPNFQGENSPTELVAKYLKLMKNLFGFLKKVNKGNDIFIVIRAREFKVFDEDLNKVQKFEKVVTRAVDHYHMIDYSS